MLKTYPGGIVDSGELQTRQVWKVETARVKERSDALVSFEVEEC